MLGRLFVKNYAIIDESEVNFKDKLNILTGETGAGKSILIGSVNAALGQKTSKDVIRYGADYCAVELVFCNLSDKTVSELKEYDIYPDDGEIVISRKITTAGKSICKINGETVSLEELKNCSSLLLDIHGQNEHHSLLKASSHCKIIDKFAGDEVAGLLSELKVKYGELLSVQKEKAEAMSVGTTKETDVDYLEYAANEIEAANLIPSEDVQLEEEYKVLSNKQQIIEALNIAVNLVDSEDGCASELISNAVRALSKIVEYDEKLSEMSGILENASELLSDFRHEADSYADRAENSEERFRFVSERLDCINGLKKKYGGYMASIEDVLKYAEDARAKIDKFSNNEEYIAELTEKEKRLTSVCLALCERISELRKKAAVSLDERISEALKELNFTAATFKCAFERNEKFNADGFDKAEFMVSLNPGEPLKPLVKVASGGELSRVMLAVKTVLADKDEIPTLIFDEIDTGISGRTAQKVSEKLAAISKHHQVICITHLAQIAAMADNHYLIEKTDGGNSVHTEIRELDSSERSKELARILSGAEVTETVMESANEMISMAESVKIKERSK